MTKENTQFEAQLQFVSDAVLAFAHAFRYVCISFFLLLKSDFSTNATFKNPTGKPISCKYEVGFKNGICRIRLTDWFVAYQGSGNLGDSKAAHSCGSQKFWSVQSLSLSPDSGLGDTDRSYFDFHSIFSDFVDL